MKCGFPRELLRIYVSRGATRFAALGVWGESPAGFPPRGYYFVHCR